MPQRTDIASFPQKNYFPLYVDTCIGLSPGEWSCPTTPSTANETAAMSWRSGRSQPGTNFIKIVAIKTL